MSEKKQKVEKLGEVELDDPYVQSYTEWWQEIFEKLASNDPGINHKQIVKATNAILSEVGKCKRGDQANGKSEKETNNNDARPGVEAYLKKHKDDNDFLNSLWESFEEYGHLTDNQYEAIEDSIDN